MSSHQTNKDKPEYLSATISVIPLMYTTTALPAERWVREMIPVSLYCHLVISAPSLTEEQQTKITHRKRYIKSGHKKSDKNDDLDTEILGDNSIDSFEGSHAELEVASECLFTSPSQPQPLLLGIIKYTD